MIVPLYTVAQGPGDWILIIFHISFAVSTTIANCLLILAIVSSAKLRKRNNFLYTLSITITDLIVGCGWFYNGTYLVLESLSGGYDAAGIFPMFHGISLLTLMAAMVDRYYAVQYPFDYTKNMTRTKVLTIIAATWLMSIANTVIKTEIPKWAVFIYHSYCSLLGSIVLVFVMACLNVHLYLVTKQQLSREKQTDGEAKRSSHLIIITSVMFIILWTPSLMYCGFCFYMGLCYSIPYNAVQPYNILRVLNTLTTPIVFLCGSPLTRASLRNIWDRVTCKSAKVEPDDINSPVVYVNH
ncbi:galanin receptor 2a-like [Petromyzon marinus]|uniref:Adrenocorticotropic hormone receptor-like n=1 Tax=Petromyzon marinus TaxID=7757 RepID=A0AAJ7SP79_PETMA|nr:adrenocorticotropic hormone receptor-like [Petromyzon marinus]